MTAKKDSTLETATGSAGEQDVQKKVDAENADGYRGVRQDPTPLENYTLAGVIAGAPTPETDADALAKAREASAHARS